MTMGDFEIDKNHMTKYSLDRLGLLSRYFFRTERKRKGTEAE